MWSCQWWVHTQKLDAGYSYPSPFLYLSLSLFPSLFCYLFKQRCVVSCFLGFPTNFVGEDDIIKLACTPYLVYTVMEKGPGFMHGKCFMNRATSPAPYLCSLDVCRFYSTQKANSCIFFSQFHSFSFSMQTVLERSPFFLGWQIWSMNMLRTSCRGDERRYLCTLVTPTSCISHSN